MERGPFCAMKATLRQLITLGATATLLAVAIAPAEANKLDAVAQRLANGCKLRVVEQFDVSMADARLSLGATLKQSLDSGAMTMKDVKTSGLTLDWSVNGKSAKGYCNVDYDGNVKEFKQW
jgi:hypothetical protein